MPDGPYANGEVHKHVVLNDEPLGYYRLGAANPLLDEGRYGQDLTAINAPTDVAPLITVGRARHFDEASLQAYTSPIGGIGDEFGIEAWIMFDTVGESQTLFSNGADGFWLRYSASEARLILRRQDGGAGVVDLANTGGVTFAVDVPYHVMAWKDGANGARICVNGVDRTNETNAATVSATATDINIGRKSTATEHFTGVMDEIAFYGYAPTVDMALIHYLSGSLEQFGEVVAGKDGLMPSLLVEIAFDSWNEQYPQWRNVTEFLRKTPIKITCSGRTDETVRTAPSSADAQLDDRDGRFDPSRSDGPYGDRVLPRRQIRIRAGWDGSAYHLFRGWVSSWPPQWPNSGFDGIVDLECKDFFDIFTNEIPSGTSFSAELAGARIETCLTALGVPTQLQNVDAGIVTMPEVESASGTWLEHMHAVAESDGGFLYISTDGRVTYEQRTFRYGQATVATFGDDPDDPTELKFVELTPSKDDDFLFTRVEITSGDGTGTGVAEDAAQLADIGPITLTRSLLTGFNQCQAAAEWYLARYKDPVVRFLSMSAKGVKSPDEMWPVLLAAWNSQRYEFIHRPMSGGTMTQESYVERMEHQIGDGDWVVSWALSPRGDEDPWMLDDASYVLGTNTVPTW